MFPEIPANFAELSAADLRAFARAVKAAAITVLAAGPTAEQRAEVKTFLAKRDEAIALAADKDAAQALESNDDDADPAAAAKPAPAPVPEPEVPAEPEPAAEPEVPAEPVPEPGLAKTPKIPTTFGQQSTPSGDTLVKPKRIVAEYLTAADNVKGKNAGDGFESWAELAAAAIDKAGNINAASSEKFTIATIKGNYPKDRILSDNYALNLSKFEPDELTAALCAPATPYYNLACMNSTRRPVFASLPQFQSPTRMKVSVQSSPTLADITTGHGIWTATDDANPAAIKTCQTTACGTTTEYVMYGLYRCLTVTNMLAMSYPELVEAYLNRLAAAHARDGEIALLNAMATGATSIQANLLGYGATTSIVSTILNYIALYQETQRWDITENMEAWLPRWVQTAMKMDLFRRRNTMTPVSHVVSDAQVDALFSEAGVNVHWFMDSPTWSVALPAVATANRLNIMPQNIQMLIAPPGKFAIMDRGELAIGVTGNGIYRDNASNTKNTFTFFFENFEGVVNTTSCPAHLIDLPVCWTGVQVDDNLVNCLGQDELGYQS